VRRAGRPNLPDPICYPGAKHVLSSNRPALLLFGWRQDAPIRSPPGGAAEIAGRKRRLGGCACAHTIRLARNFSSTTARHYEASVGRLRPFARAGFRIACEG